jgi:hypothetical protein
MTELDRKIFDIEWAIADQEHWLSPEQGMSNPMKIRRRKNRLKKLRIELDELKKQKK